MIKIFIKTILIISLLNMFSYKVNSEDINSSFSLKWSYELYKERVKNICNEYKPKKLIIAIEENYPRILNEWEEESENTVKSYDLDDIKDTHRDNMNNIYKCALLNVQRNSYLVIKKDLIKKNPDLAKKLDWKISNNIKKIELSSKALWCLNSEDKNSIQKLKVLKQATYQTCKYTSYLEYLKESNKEIRNIIIEQENQEETFLPQNKSYNLWEIATEEVKRKKKLNKEIKNTYKVFPIAFQAYTEYENNITIHFLLELIKEDYKILRDKLHKSLNPINQVVYKMRNAMTK